MSERVRIADDFESIRKHLQENNPSILAAVVPNGGSKIVSADLGKEFSYTEKTLLSSVASSGVLLADDGTMYLWRDGCWNVAVYKD